MPLGIAFRHMASDVPDIDQVHLSRIWTEVVVLFVGLAAGIVMICLSVGSNFGTNMTYGYLVSGRERSCSRETTDERNE